MIVSQQRKSAKYLSRGLVWSVFFMSRISLMSRSRLCDLFFRLSVRLIERKFPGVNQKLGEGVQIIQARCVNGGIIFDVKLNFSSCTNFINKVSDRPQSSSLSPETFYSNFDKF